MQSFVVTVEGMTCGHCERAAEAALRDLEGVHTAVADRVAGRVVVTVEDGHDLSLDTVAAALADEGYSATGIVAAAPPPTSDQG